MSSSRPGYRQQRGDTAAPQAARAKTTSLTFLRFISAMATSCAKSVWLTEFSWTQKVMPPILCLCWSLFWGSVGKLVSGREISKDKLFSAAFTRQGWQIFQWQITKCCKTAEKLLLEWHWLLLVLTEIFAKALMGIWTPRAPVCTALERVFVIKIAAESPRTSNLL